MENHTNAGAVFETETVLACLLGLFSDILRRGRKASQLEATINNKLPGKIL